MSTPQPRNLAGAARYAVGLAWRADRRSLLTVVIAQLGSAFLLAGIVLLARHLLDRALSAGPVAATGATAVPMLAATVALGAVGGIIRIVAGTRQRVLAMMVDRHVIGLVLRAAARAELPEFETPAFHDRLQRAVHAARAQPAMVVTALVAALQAVFTVVAVLVMLAVLAWWLVPVVLLASLPPLRTARDERRAGYRLHHSLAEDKRRRQYLERLLTGWHEAKEIRALGLGDLLRRRWAAEYDREVTGTLAMHRKHVRRKVMARVGGDLTVVAVIGVMWWQVTNGRIGLSTALAALAALWQLSLRLQMVGATLNGVGESVLYLGDLRELDRNLAPVPPAAQPAEFRELRAERLGFTYPEAGRPTLTDVSITIRPGEIVALVGANGSGKTTLAKILAGLYRPDSGTLWHGEQPITDAASLRRLSAVVFQDFVRYRLPAMDNITFGRPDEPVDEARAVTAAREVGAHDFLSRLPLTYRTPLSAEFSGGVELSGGQWQRLALARARYRDAPFVVLDEPTSALDPEAEAELFAHIRQLFAGRTVLLISHRFSSVRHADRIYVLEAGRVIEEGSHETLIAASGTYARLFDLQAEGYRDLVP